MSTTTTPWAHLPNAAHIDTVLKFVETHAEHPAWTATRAATRAAAWNAALNAARDAAWDAARNAARNAAWIAARDAAWAEAWIAAWDAVQGAVRDAAWDAAWDEAWNAARNAARDAVCALVALDCAGEILNKPLVVVEAMAAMDDAAAVLLLAYMTARENITT